MIYKRYIMYFKSLYIGKRDRVCNRSEKNFSTILTLYKRILCIFKNFLFKTSSYIHKFFL